MLAEIPVALILVGIAAYVVLAGADFGAGFWTLVSRSGRAGREAARDHGRHAMGPVWEANHVWLVFILVVCWTAYPVAFASTTSTLSVPLFIAAVGIILRGASYALRGQLEGASGRRAIESVFALSSILTPFALGTVAGAIAAGRVPVGNAEGNLLTSWLNPTSITIGALAVATSAYLAAVYLAADARALGARALEIDFRSRALAAGLAAGAVAVSALLVVRADAPDLWKGFERGGALAMIVVSAVAGVWTLLLVWRSRFGPARVSAAIAVAAIVAGWALAQRPRFLPGLTVTEAAAGRSTLLAVVIAVAVGALVLVPALALLFTLFLRGRLSGLEDAHPTDVRIEVPARRSRPLGPVAVSLLLAGVFVTVVADGGWARIVGVVCLFGGAVSTFALATAPVDDD